MVNVKTNENTAGSKARNDAYVMMLFIMFLALGGGVLMYLDRDAYADKSPPAAPKIGAIAVDARVN